MLASASADCGALASEWPELVEELERDECASFAAVVVVVVGPVVCSFLAPFTNSLSVSCIRS